VQEVSRNLKFIPAAYDRRRQVSATGQYALVKPANLELGGRVLFLSKRLDARVISAIGNDRGINNHHVIHDVDIAQLSRINEEFYNIKRLR
jgi:hypothetical protein